MRLRPTIYALLFANRPPNTSCPRAFFSKMPPDTWITPLRKSIPSPLRGPICETGLRVGLTATWCGFREADRSWRETMLCL